MFSFIYLWIEYGFGNVFKESKYSDVLRKCFHLGCRQDPWTASLFMQKMLVCQEEILLSGWFYNLQLVDQDVLVHIKAVFSFSIEE